MNIRQALSEATQDLEISHNRKAARKRESAGLAISFGLLAIFVTIILIGA